jgi:hypothetical protein
VIRLFNVLKGMDCYANIVIINTDCNLAHPLYEGEAWETPFWILIGNPEVVESGMFPITREKDGENINTLVITISDDEE